jgi:hypothetical protein
VKTIFIWDSCGETALKFFVVEGDFEHLNRLFVNATDGDEDLQEELQALVNHAEMQETFPIDVVYREGEGNVKVITCGYFP